MAVGDAAFQPRHKADLSGVRWVGQDHARGCGIACLAMVMGRTYDDVLAEVSARFPERDFTEIGLYYGDEQWLLGEHGYAWRTRFKNSGGPWPCEPFAPAHIVQVEQPSGSYHFVVMLADGTVLDPLADEPTSLDAWPRIINVLGVWHVG